MSDIEFEKAVRTALIMDIDKTYGFNDDISDGSIPHSPRYLRFEKKILRDPMGYVNRVSQSVSKRVMKTAAMIVLTIAVLFGLMMAIPPVRAFVFSVVEEFVDHNEHKTYETRIDKEIGKCSVGYIPNGYKISTVNNGNITLTNGDEIIRIAYDYTHSDMWISVDNDGMKIESIMIGENQATIYNPWEMDKETVIVWFDENEKLCFVVSSTIDAEELIKVAESIYIE